MKSRVIPMKHNEEYAMTAVGFAPAFPLLLRITSRTSRTMIVVIKMILKRAEDIAQRLKDGRKSVELFI